MKIPQINLNEVQETIRNIRPFLVQFSDNLVNFIEKQSDFKLTRIEKSKIQNNVLKEMEKDLTLKIDNINLQLKNNIVVPVGSQNVSNLVQANVNLLLENQSMKIVTEVFTQSVIEKSKREVYEDKDYYMVWTSERDDLVRDAHFEADGQTPDSDGYFTVGGEKLKYPGGGSLPENNINCRCQLTPIKRPSIPF